MTLRDPGHASSLGPFTNSERDHTKYHNSVVRVRHELIFYTDLIMMESGEILICTIIVGYFVFKFPPKDNWQP
jgi:hypothetical protein